MFDNNAIGFERKIIARIFYGYLLFIFLIEGLNHHLLHQLLQPVLIDPEADNMYWLLHLMCIPQFISGSTLNSMLLEISIITTAIFCIVFTSENRLSILFTVLLLVYTVTKNSYVSHHEHGLDGPLMMSLIFWAKDEQRFVFLFKAFRYYVIFVFVSAALWKVSRGGIFLPEQFSEILKQQHLNILTLHPESSYGRFITWLIGHVTFSKWLLIGATLLQLFFITGFFTYRFDRALLILFFAFFIGDYVLMDLSFYQWYVCALVFFYPGKVCQFFPRRNRYNYQMI